ncbi:MAG: hypothetical protein ACYS5V_02295 [Planctomycetota bacterium]|jgi:hypothetical protein
MIDGIHTCGDLHESFAAPPLRSAQIEADLDGDERKLMDVSISHVKELVEIVRKTFPELAYAPTARLDCEPAGSLSAMKRSMSTRRTA